MRDQGQNLQACRECDLLFEVSGQQLAACPECGRAMSFFKPRNTLRGVMPPSGRRDDADGHTRLVSQLPLGSMTANQNIATGMEPRETTEPGRRLLETTQLINVDSDWDTPESTSQDSMFDDLDATRALSVDLFDLSEETAFQAPTQRGGRLSPGQAVPNAAKLKKESPPPVPPTEEFGAASSKYLVDRESLDVASPAELRRGHPLETQESIGPDPRPRARTPRGRRKSTTPKRSEPQTRATLDAATPRPLEAKPKKSTGDKRPAAHAAKRPSMNRRQRTSNTLASTGESEQLTDADVISDVLKAAQEEIHPHQTEAFPQNRARGLSKKFRVGMYGLVLVSVAVGAALILTRKSDDAVPHTVARLQRSDLSSSLVRLGVRPLIFERADLLNQQPYIVMTPTLTLSSAGPVKGLKGSADLSHMMTNQQVKGGPQRLLEHLADATQNNTLLVGLRPEEPVKTLEIVIQTGLKAGYPEVGLIVEREADGRLGSFPLNAGLGTIPAVGCLDVRISKGIASANIVGRKGETLGETLPNIAAIGASKINLKELDKRIAKLHESAPLVRLAILRVPSEMELADTMEIVKLIRFGDRAERFRSVRLVSE